MYKLVAVAGQIRGQQYILKDGENIIGRSQQAHILMNIKGISKNHARIFLENNQLEVHDMGSANGVFVNDSLVKSQKLKVGDLVALPGVVFRVVYDKSNNINSNISAFKSNARQKNDQEGNIFIRFVKNKIMPIIYGFNEAYEWRYLIAIIFFAFIATNIMFILSPILSDTNSLLLREIKLRGAQYADEVARLNAAALARGELDRINTSFLDTSRDIVSYQLFDLDGRILRPLSKLNSYYNDSFSIEARSWILQREENINEVYHKKLDEGEIGIARAIKMFNIEQQKEVPVGFITIKFLPVSLVVEAANNRRAYLESLIISVVVGLFFLVMIYYATLKPITELNEQLEVSLSGQRNELKSTYLMQEIIPLRNNLNMILNRYHDLSSGDSSSMTMEDDTGYVLQMKQLMLASPGPVMILDSDKKIKGMNQSIEEVLGIRELMSLDSSLLDVIRDQGLAATIIDLCDQAASSGGDCKIDSYEINGRSYEIRSASLIGRDHFSKAFYVGFSRNES